MVKLYTIFGAALIAASVSFHAAALDVATTMTEWTLNPADGAEVTRLEDIRVTFPQPAYGIEVGVMQENVGNYCTLTCGETVYRAKQARVTGSGYQVGEITFDPITTPGVYTLHIANGVFYDYELAEMSDNENDPYPTHPDIAATYTIVEGGSTDVPTENPLLEYETMPMDGEVLDEISMVDIAFPGATGGLELAGAFDDIALLKGTLFVTDASAADIEEDMVTVTLTDAVTEAGTYTLVIPEGMFKATGTDFVNEEIRLTLKIEGGASVGENKMGVYTVDPADGSTVDKLSRIDIAFTEVADGIDQYGSFNSLVITCDGEPVDLPYTMITAGSSYEVLAIVFSEDVTTPGEYVITIPAEVVRDYTTSGDDVHTNPEIVLHYTVSIGSGIEAVEATAGSGHSTVFDLSGRALRSDRLDAGIYIVNGKKIVIRK